MKLFIGVVTGSLISLFIVVCKLYYEFGELQYQLIEYHATVGKHSNDRYYIEPNDAIVNMKCGDTIRFMGCRFFAK